MISFNFFNGMQLYSEMCLDTTFKDFEISYKLRKINSYYDALRKLKQF